MLANVLNFSHHAVTVKATSFQLFDDVFPPTVLQSVPPSFPCGFQVKSWVVMLSSDFLIVCPVQLHVCLTVCSNTGILLDNSISYTFEILSLY